MRLSSFKYHMEQRIKVIGSAFIFIGVRFNGL